MRALVLGLLLGTLAVSTARADELKVGDRVAELDGAVDISGHPVHVKAIKGWKVLTFGASWCKPCAKELPTWDKLAPEWKGKVQFIAVDLDSEKSAGKAFHRKLGLHHMMLVYMSPESSSAAKYGSDHMPTTVVADPHGVIRYIRGGFEKGDTDGELRKLRAELKKLVK